MNFRSRVLLQTELLNLTATASAGGSGAGQTRAEWGAPQRRLGASPGCRSYTDDQGLMSSTPTPEKSFSFLVAKDASLARQMAAICASYPLIGVP